MNAPGSEKTMTFLPLNTSSEVNSTQSLSTRVLKVAFGTGLPSIFAISVLLMVFGAWDYASMLRRIHAFFWAFGCSDGLSAGDSARALAITARCSVKKLDVVGQLHCHSRMVRLAAP